jgi:hypothetical protein
MAMMICKGVGEKPMKSILVRSSRPGLRPTFCFKAVVLFSLILMLCVHSAVGQEDKQELAGPWKFVSSTSQRDDGSTAWGPNPKGLLIFTNNGHFSLQIMRSDRPKYKSGTRQRASLIENQATTRGTLSYFGTYAVSELDHSVTFHIESSTYPNLSDTDQKRQITLSGDNLKVENLTPSRGTGPTVQIWERAK